MKPAPKREIDLRQRIRESFERYIAFANGYQLQATDYYPLGVIRDYGKFKSGDIEIDELVIKHKDLIERDPYDKSLVKDWEKYKNEPASNQ